MSDHVDGPRSIGDPAADVTDLFAFTSPGEPGAHRPRHVRFPRGRRKCDFLERHRSLDRRSPRDRCGRWQCREVSARGRRDPLQLPVRGPEARCRREGDPARRLHTAGRSRTVAHGERREGGVDAGGRCPRVRRAAIRPVLPRLDRRRAQEGAKPAAARQRALHGRRARYAPRARSGEGLVVRRDRRDRPGPQPRGRVSHPVARIDWVGRPEQTNIRLTNPGAVGGRRLARPVESADAVCDLAKSCSRCSCSA